MRALCLFMLQGILLAGSALKAEPAELRYFIIVTGGELLEGVYPDAHTHYITRTLFPLGAICTGSLSVDDTRDGIKSALDFATRQAPVVIITGGLGPTPNDITREVVSEFTAIKLVEDEDLLATMEKRLNQNRSQIRPNLRRQVKVPGKNNFFANSNGTAAGLIFKTEQNLLLALPGPPRELQPMLQNEVIPFLQKRFDLHTANSRLMVRFYGLGQSQIDQVITEKIQLPPGTIETSLFEGMRVDFFFTLPGKSPGVSGQISKLASDLRSHLGESIYAEDNTSLEQVVLRNLKKKNHRAVIIDFATGGSLSSALNNFSEATGTIQATLCTSDGPQLAQTLGSNETELPQLINLASQRCNANYAIVIEKKSDGKLNAKFGPVKNLTSVDFPFQGNQQFVSALLDTLRRSMK